MSFELRYIPPAEIHNYWDMVQEDLDHCRQQDEDEVWLEDVYHCICSGAATLHVGFIQDQYIGCLVLTTRAETFNPSNKVLHIWFCSNKAGHELLRMGQQEVEKMARAIGANRITYRANRLAFERLTQDLGYKLANIEFVREI